MSEIEYYDLPSLVRILNSLNIGVVFIDAKNRIAFVNKTAEEIRGIKSEDRVGTSVFDCHNGTLNKKVDSMIEDFRKGVQVTRHKMIKTQGKYFDNTYNVVSDEEGSYKGIVLISQNVTDKTLLEQQLKQTNEELEKNVEERTKEIEATYKELQIAQKQLMQSEKMASIGQFVSGLAHEINNPLDGIQNCLRTVLADIKNFDQTKKYLSLALEGLFKIELLVRQLLDYARPHSHEKIILDVNDLLNDVLELTRFKIKNTKIKIETNFCQENLVIYGDEHYLQQVFVNIILNGFDSMGSKGLLSITTSKLGSGNVCIKISDTGCGIPVENISKIFDPFFTTKLQSSGTGLGLYLSYNVIKDHSGNISVESKKGEGATFTINIPVAKEEELSLYDLSSVGKHIL